MSTRHFRRFRVFALTVALWGTGSWLVAGCESPGRDDQDAMDDTLGVIDAVLDTNQDTALHHDVNTDAPPSVDILAGGDTVAIGQLADAIAQWECLRILGCGCSAPNKTKPELASCVAQLTPAISKTWANGGLVARAELIPACLAALEADSAPCTVAKLTSVTPCLAALRWPGNAGDACGGNGPFLCADGGLCEGGKCTGNHLGLIAVGQSCSNPFVCGDAECVKNPAGKGTCQVPVAVGQACVNDNDCALPGLCKSGTCALPGKVGEKCASVVDCGSGLDCVSGSCAAPTTCSLGSTCGNGGDCLGEIHNSCLTRKAVGDGCNVDAECVETAYCSTANKQCTDRPGVGKTCGDGVACAAGLGCDTAKMTCQSLPKTGGKCLLGPIGPSLCAAGSACKPDTFLCADPPLENEACAVDHTCSDLDIDGDGKKGDLACNITAKGKVCSKKLAVGATCQNEACQDGLFCDTSTGKCTKTYASGSACKAGKECGPGASCVPNSSGKLSCGPMPKATESCLTDCASGLYCDMGTQDAACQPAICGDLFAVQ